MKKGLKETAEKVKEGIEDTAEEEERKANAAREAANRDKDTESPNHREVALNRKRNTLNDQNANSNQQETYRQSV